MNQELIGSYTFKSPYHKGNKRLPFEITGVAPSSDGFNMNVETVEYKGRTRHTVKTRYTRAAIQVMIREGIIKRRT